jgi:hypothetical protein
MGPHKFGQTFSSLNKYKPLCTMQWVESISLSKSLKLLSLLGVSRSVLSIMRAAHCVHYIIRAAHCFVATLDAYLSLGNPKRAFIYGVH